MTKRLPFLSALLFLTTVALAQTATVRGTVRDARTEEPLELTDVYLLDAPQRVVQTDTRGNFTLTLPARSAATLEVARVGYEAAQFVLEPMEAGTVRTLAVALVSTGDFEGVEVRASSIQDGGMIREGVEELKLLPTTTGNFESVLPYLALGTSGGSGGELSSQYNVRGGNYDENLVYVNDFQIYRPQLIRAGQQEGLSFPNLNLISSLAFSSGGFESRYGDRLSSVLDIRYKRPTEFRASADASLLGGGAHVEGSVQPRKNSFKRLRYLAGARYKTTRYLLGTLDVTGEYIPNFADVQGYLTYDLSPAWTVGILGNYNDAVYNFTPESRRTAFGLINLGLQLRSDLQGGETDDFSTALLGTSFTYLPDRKRNPIFLKFLASGYQSQENERFDIIGDYQLGQIETDLGADDGDFGEVVAVLGNGRQQQYVRNFLTSQIVNLEHKGGLELQLDRDADAEASHFFQWSVKYQLENHDDQLNEWEVLDSAGYSLPYDPEVVRVFSVLKSENELETQRVTAALQNTFSWRRDSVGEFRATVGLRGGYRRTEGGTVDGTARVGTETWLTPRAQLAWKPQRSGSKDISYRLAGGLYYQPPYYREFRRPDGTLNLNLRAQKSAHVVAGLTHDFMLGRANFRFIAEAYYKRLWDVTSYEIDNVRIRYSGENDADGSVMGIDFRLNGEFVPGSESWINLSFLRARENLLGVEHQSRELNDRNELITAPVDDVPRPTDQLMQVAVFFQDYLPKNENLRTHVNLTVGTGLPYGLPTDNTVFRNSFRFSPYHRIDIGLSALLWNESRRAAKPRHPLRFTRNAWLSLEVFNLMAVQNAASNTFIKTIFAQQYAIPNYLTGRRLNLRMRVEF